MSQVILLVVVIAASYVAVQAKSKRSLAKRRTALSQGEQIDVVCAMRVRSEGRISIGRRWRQGTIRHADGELQFVPYRPRKAKTFNLEGLHVTGERPRTTAELWWFSGPTVLLAESPTLGAIELGFGTGEWIELARGLLTPSG